MSTQALLLVAVFLPFAVTPLIAAFGRWPDLRESVTLVTAPLLFLVVGVLYSRRDIPASPVALLETLPGLSIAFTVEALGLLFALVASFLWIITTVYSIGYMRHHNERHQTRFYLFFAIAIGSAMGIAFAANLFTLFIFYEVLTLSTYPLVTHAGSDAARDGGRTYLGYLLGTSVVLLLPALIWTWLSAGTLEFRSGGILEGKLAPAAAGLLLAMYVFGVGKAAVIPFHRWLPAAMVAPTPVSALLHAVAVVKAGVFSLLKIGVYVFGIDYLAAIPLTEWLMYIAAATILYASLLALRQDNLKLRLAYSTVSQLSYVVMGVLLATPHAVLGGAVHIAMHAFAKITLFFCAGAILVTLHKARISEMRGIGRRMPWTMTAFTVGALSMIGLPLTAGFIGKWYIMLGAVDAGQFIAVAVIILSTLLNAGYFMPIVYAAFFRQPDTPVHGHGSGVTEAPGPILLAIGVTAVGTLALFLLAGAPLLLGRQLIGGAT